MFAVSALTKKYNVYFPASILTATSAFRIGGLAIQLVRCAENVCQGQKKTTR